MAQTCGSFVVVTGSPGSGKTTVAAVVGRALRFPVISKDVIKEALLDTLPASTVDESRRLGAAAVRVLLAVASGSNAAVLESTWRRSLALDDLARLPGRIVEIHCNCSPSVARSRYVSRVRHQGHFDADRIHDDELWHGEPAQALAGGWPVIEVNTEHPIDTDSLVEAVRSNLVV
jgi:predicted kinase